MSQGIGYENCLSRDGNCHYRLLAIPRGGPALSAWRKRELFYPKERALPLNLQIDGKIFYVLSISGRPRDLYAEWKGDVKTNAISHADLSRGKAVG
jgi:hypothetical protein